MSRQGGVLAHDGAPQSSYYFLLLIIEGIYPPIEAVEAYERLEK